MGFPAHDTRQPLMRGPFGVPAGGRRLRPQGLLALVRYAPAGTTSTSTISATLVAVDAVNLVVTFAFPASGAVLVRLQAAAQMSTSAAVSQWGLLNASGGGQVGDTALLNQLGGTNDIEQAVDIYVAGPPESVMTLQWAHRTSGGTLKTVYGDGTAANGSPALMSVWPAV